MYKLAAISIVIHIHNTVRGTANPYEYNDAKRKHFKLIVLGNIVGYCSAILIIDYFTLPSSQRPFLRKRNTFATLSDQPLSLQSFFFLSTLQFTIFQSLLLECLALFSPRFCSPSFCSHFYLSS